MSALQAAIRARAAAVGLTFARGGIREYQEDVRVYPAGVHCHALGLPIYYNQDQTCACRGARNAMSLSLHALAQWLWQHGYIRDYEIKGILGDMYLVLYPQKGKKDARIIAARTKKGWKWTHRHCGQ